MTSIPRDADLVAPDDSASDVAAAGQETPADEQLDDLAADLDALANIQRLRLLHLLTRPRYAEEVAGSLGMSRQSALKHIAKLQERGFVRALHGRRATGPVIEFLVVPPRLFAVGVSLGDLGKLEPEGGPMVRNVERTERIVEAEGRGRHVEVVPQSAALLVIHGPDAGRRFALSATTKRWTIGRDEDRDLRMTHDPFISGRHAEIQMEQSTLTPVLVDVFSANGTFLNFNRIPRGGRVPLRQGDVIGVGHTMLVYQPNGD